ncbi:hypothetical protein SLE2022_021590 [Rubroshorea leprosula]
MEGASSHVSDPPYQSGYSPFLLIYHAKESSSVVFRLNLLHLIWGFKYLCGQVQENGEENTKDKAFQYYEIEKRRMRRRKREEIGFWRN